MKMTLKNITAFWSALMIALALGTLGLYQLSVSTPREARGFFWGGVFFWGVVLYARHTHVKAVKLNQAQSHESTLIAMQDVEPKPLTSMQLNDLEMQERNQRIRNRNLDINRTL